MDNFEKNQDGTVAFLATMVNTFWSLDNKAGWNSYPVYVECDDGTTRKVKVIGSKLIPHGLKTEGFPYEGGFYLKAEV